MNLTPNSKHDHTTGRVRLRRTLDTAAGGASVASIIGDRATAEMLAPLASLRSEWGSTESHPTRRGERGSATVLVLALVAMMMAFLTANQLVLHNLKRELRIVEQKQLKKFQPPAAKPAAPPARP